MSVHALTQKRSNPVPPLKGSFPLDHEGECKESMVKYMRCLRENRNQTIMCRPLAKEYLSCRMDHNLMEREEWRRLGFTEEETKKQT